MIGREVEELAAILLGGDEPHQLIEWRDRPERCAQPVLDRFAVDDVIEQLLPLLEASTHRLRAQCAPDRRRSIGAIWLLPSETT